MTQPLIRHHLMAVLFIALSLAMSTPTWAWSRYGHETIGHLAMLHLNDQAKAEIEALLGDENLGSVAAWADRVRGDRRETAPYHYVNGPRDQLVPSHDDLNLPQGTVYTAIALYQDQLRDPATPQLQRIEALKFLVHFVGDIHQPLHVGFGDDLGGNRFEVLYRDEAFNLHRYWDLNVMEPRLDRYTSREYAQYLDQAFSDEEQALWLTQDDPLPWIIEGRRYLFAGLYPVPQRVDGAPPVALMDDTYREVWMPVAEVQITRAGLRLAGLLNQLFAAP